MDALKPNKVPKFPIFFIILNIALIIGIYFLLTYSIKDILTDTILKSTEHSNSTMTRVFVNEVYPRLKDSLQLTDNRQKAKDELSSEEVEVVDNAVRKFMLGTDILKVKIYNINGVTVYSSHEQQIGEVEIDNAGFTKAITGSSVSQITHRGSFSAFDGEVFDRDLIASYIPIYAQGQVIVGVAEVYTDRSQAVDFIEDRLVTVQAVIIPALAAILLFASFVIWRVFHFSMHSNVSSLDRF